MQMKTDLQTQDPKKKRPAEMVSGESVNPTQGYARCTAVPAYQSVRKIGNNS